MLLHVAATRRVCVLNMAAEVFSLVTGKEWGGAWGSRKCGKGGPEVKGEVPSPTSPFGLQPRGQLVT